MNILIIPAWYPLNDKDLTASFIREQAHALFRRGHKISVLFIKAFSLREIKEYNDFNNYVWKDKGINTNYYKCLSIIPSRFEKMYHNHLARKYYKIIKKNIHNNVIKPDLIHAHVGPWCSYFVIPAAKKLKIPVVTTEHYSGLTNGDVNDIKFKREKYVIENSNLTIFVGSNLQKSVFKATGANGNSIVVPNQINPDMFRDTNKTRKDGVFRFITACHLVPLKKVENVITAFHNEFSVSENVEYIIAGDGFMRDKLEELVKQLGETDRIHFRGSYNREEMPLLFSSCDAFVLTSEFETFGIVYIEAMMCGLPCIGTKGQGSDDIISRRNGLSVEFGDSVQLRNAMRYIYEHIKEYNSQDIRNDVINRFSEKVICEELESCYTTIIEKH